MYQFSWSHPRIRVPITEVIKGILWIENGFEKKWKKNKQAHTMCAPTLLDNAAHNRCHWHALVMGRKLNSNIKNNRLVIVTFIAKYSQTALSHSNLYGENGDLLTRFHTSGKTIVYFGHSFMFSQKKKNKSEIPVNMHMYTVCSL